jgi:hypothetical protein
VTAMRTVEQNTTVVVGIADGAYLRKARLVH